METLKVTLPGRSYEILIGGGLLDGCGERIRAVTGAETVAVVTDSNVAPLYLRQVEESLRAAGFAVFSVVFPAGEQSKTTETLNMLYERFAAAGLTRGDAVAALGGGVTGDLAGFAAATMFRGMDYIQLPTTLLAQVDSLVMMGTYLVCFFLMNVRLPILAFGLGCIAFCLIYSVVACVLVYRLAPKTFRIRA